MSSVFESQLHAYAEVIVRIGLNLQRGQRLLITDPYELQGVDRSAEALVAAIQRVTGIKADIIWSSPARVRQFAEKADWRGWARLVADNAEIMSAAIRDGTALLFLPGSHPEMLAGLPEKSIGELRRIGWEYFGPVAQVLMQGATNWTAAPAPAQPWAEAAYFELPVNSRLPALWRTVFAACRVTSPTPNPLASWRDRLTALQSRRDQLNAKKIRTLRYVGDGTDLRVMLPPHHRWCTAALVTNTGVPFVANLPTEEIFTLPHRDSAEGHARVARPIHYAGIVIDGIELVFQKGRVVSASAVRNQGSLQRLLELDEGASRLGEVAFVPGATSLAREKRLFHHAMLDENATSHIALGEGYGFCLRAPDAAAHNRSLIHVDLALDARVEFDGAELS